MGPWFGELNKGATGEAYDRLKIALTIRHLDLTDWGSRLFMFENFNGTPLQTLLSLTDEAGGVQRRWPPGWLCPQGVRN